MDASDKERMTMSITFIGIDNVVSVEANRLIDEQCREMGVSRQDWLMFFVRLGRTAWLNECERLSIVLIDSTNSPKLLIEPPPRPTVRKGSE